MLDAAGARAALVLKWNSVLLCKTRVGGAGRQGFAPSVLVVDHALVRLGLAVKLAFRRDPSVTVKQARHSVPALARFMQGSRRLTVGSPSGSAPRLCGTRLEIGGGIGDCVCGEIDIRYAVHVAPNCDTRRASRINRQSARALEAPMGGTRCGTIAKAGDHRARACRPNRRAAAQAVASRVPQLVRSRSIAGPCASMAISRRCKCGNLGHSLTVGLNLDEFFRPRGPPARSPGRRVGRRLGSRARDANGGGSGRCQSDVLSAL